MGRFGGALVSLIVLCPGQGAQKVGMGKDLALHFPAARATFSAIDDALGFSLSRLMFEGPEAELTLTQNAQPAILAHTCAVLAVVGQRLSPVVAALGHSLGEYSAYVTVGSLRPVDAARLVRRRGELMNQAGSKRPGAMAAVLGLGEKEVAAACAAASSNGEVAVPANLNDPNQIVISGDPEAVARASEALKGKGAKRVMPLRVSGAFHSPLMEPAVGGLEDAIASADIEAPRAPVVANATAEFVEDAATARRLLALQLTAPVRWIQSVQNVHARFPDATYVEVGPGHVLSNLTRRIVHGIQTIQLGTAEEIEKFLAHETPELVNRA